MKIILIGFMGAGKTSVASKLSGLLGLPAIETDDLILEKYPEESIYEVFKKYGESDFRRMEIEVAEDLKNKDDCIISTGGGAVMERTVMDCLKADSGKVFFLRASFTEISKRLRDDYLRPLFKDKKSASELFDLRQPLYENYADVTIETDAKTIGIIADEICNYLK